MTRVRNKPILSWIKRAKFEIEHEEELTIERAYELGKIRGKKETIDKAYEWLRVRNVLTEDSLKGFSNAMMEE